MSSQSAVSIKVSGIKEAMQALDPKKVVSAGRAALGYTKSSARSKAVQLMTQTWNISKKNLEQTASGKPRIEVSGKVGDDLSAIITFWSGGISLAYFGAKEFRLTVARSKQSAKRMGQKVAKGQKTLIGVRVQTLRGGRVALLRQFFARVKSGGGAGVHLGVFRRDSAGGRYKTGNAKMVESASVGIATMVNQPRVLKPLTEHITDTFNKRFAHELKRQGFSL